MLWSIIFIVLFILMFVFSKMILGSLKNPISVFSLLWCTIGVGANMAFYNYYAPLSIVNCIIFIGCIISFLVYSFFMSGYKKSFFAKKMKIENSHINMKKILFANIIAIIFLFPYTMRSLNIILSKGFAYLRAEEGVFERGIYAVLNDSFIRPLFTATTILAIVCSFSNIKKKNKFLLIIISIIINVEQIILSGGRIYFINFIFYLIIAVIIFYGSSIKSFLYYSKKYIVLGGILFFIVLLITMQRNMSKSENLFLYNAYVYYFSGPSYLSQLITNVKEYGPGGELLYGSASFGFITNIWSNIIIFFTGIPQGSLYLLGSVISNNQYFVGEHTVINAMFTCFYPFYIDYGWLGIVICPIFIGVVSAVFTKNLYRNKNIFNISIYIYWIYIIIRTVFKWDLVNLDLMVVIFSLYFFTNIKRETTNKRRK